MGCRRSRLPANAAATPTAVYPRPPSVRIPGDLKVRDDLKAWAEAELASWVRPEPSLYATGRRDALAEILDKIEELGREHG